MDELIDLGPQAFRYDPLDLFPVQQCPGAALPFADVFPERRLHFLDGDLGDNQYLFRRVDYIGIFALAMKGLCRHELASKRLDIKARRLDLL